MIRQLPNPFSTLVVLLVVWAPLPFGSVTVPFRSLLHGCVWTVLLIGLWSDASRRRTLVERGARTVWLPFGCLAGLALFAWIQSVPIPSSIVGVVSPAHVIDRPLHQVEADTSASAEDAVRSAAPERTYLSWSPDASRVAALGWMTAAAAFLCGALVGTRRERRLVFAALLASGCFQVVYGGPRFRAGDPVIWGITISDPSGRLRGTFVNPNHTAFFLALVIPIAAAWLWLVYRYVRDGEAGGAWLLWLAAPILVLVLLLGGVVLTQSRAGVLTVSMVLLVLASLMTRARHRSTAIFGALGGALLLLAVVISRSGQGVLRRFWELQVGDDAGSSRLEVYGQVIDLWGRFPIFGAGLGSFRAAFSAHSDAALQGQWWNAHSDWLELAATGGVVALLLLGLGVVSLARVLWRRRASPSRQDRAANFAVLGTLVAAGLHSAVDFGLAMPANQVVLALMLGIGVAPTRRSQGGSLPTEAEVFSDQQAPDRLA